MAEPWRTVYSESLTRSGHRLMLFATGMLIAMVMIGLLADVGIVYWVAAGVYALISFGSAAFRLSVRVSTSPSGISVTTLLGKRHLNWGEIENIVLICKPVATSRNTIPDERLWEKIIQEDSQLLLVDADRGPERISAIYVVERSYQKGMPLYAADRNVWMTLMNAWEWNEQNFDRPLDFGRED